MSSLFKNARQDFDELVWDKNDEEWEEAQKALCKRSLCRRLEQLVTDRLGQPSSWITPMIIGGYNNLYRIHVENLPSDVLVRRPSVSQAQLPEEKTLCEVATAKHIERNTKIPTPHVYDSGVCDVGPYIIIERIEHKSTMSHALTTPGIDRSIPHALDPKIPQEKLEDLYYKLAIIFLELSGQKFESIGSMVEFDSDLFKVAARPITQNMANMLQLANIPPAIFSPPHKTFRSADEYYKELARGHLVQLAFQRNDLVKSEDDCRNKYVARQLFHQLATQGRISTFGFLEDDWSAQGKTSPSKLTAPSQAHGFRLYGDDFRPGNILINDADEIVSVIDWEFTYAAPTQFVLDPPWWLLLETPEMWDDGFEDWIVNYDLRLQAWLRAVEKVEQEAAPGESESLSSRFKNIPLSAYMRESWETGRFWLTYAARKSWAFDTVFWHCLDEKFFGKRNQEFEESTFWQTRVDLLSEEAKNAMEPFVRMKMEEMKERKLVKWEPEEVEHRLALVIFE